MARHRNRIKTFQGAPIVTEQNQTQEQEPVLQKGEEVTLPEGVVAPDLGQGTEGEAAVLGVSDILADESKEQAQAEQAKAEAEPAKEPTPQPTPKPTPTTSPIVKETAPVKPQVQKQPAEAKEEKPAILDEVDQYLYDAETNGTETQKRILGAIQRFEQGLKPRTPVTPDEAFSTQWEFLQHLRWLLEKDFEEFRPAYNALLVYVYRHLGQNNASNYSALSQYNTDRHLDSWKRGQDSCNAYSNFMTLLRNTSNPRTRNSDIKKIVLDRVAPNFISEKGLSNLKAFYAV